jgi:hypothetical protein
MRKPRELAENVWYKAGSEINISEPLFRLPEAKALLHRVLHKTKACYGFEMRGLKLEGAWLTFYVKPEDGFMLPLIMQLLKQTFSLRFNIITGRKGHVFFLEEGDGTSRISWTGSRLRIRKRRTGGGGGDRQVGKHAGSGGDGLYLELGQP